MSFYTNCVYPSNCFSATTITEQTNTISLYSNPTNTTISMQEYAKGIYVFKVAYGDIVEKLKVVKE